MPSVWDSSPSDWQAAVGVAWSASQWRGAEGADVTRERATSVAEGAPSSFTGLSFNTSRYIDGPTCPPIIYCMFICTVLFFLMLTINVCYLVWCCYNRKSSAARLRDVCDQQRGSAPVEGTESKVNITFFHLSFGFHQMERDTTLP